MVSLNFEGFGVKPEWDEPRDTDIVSRQSDMSTFLLSPSRLALERAVKPLPSYEMVRGSLTHKLIEDRINGVEYMQLIVGPEIEKRLVDLCFDDGFNVHQIASQQTIDQMVDEARAAFIGWHAGFWEPEGQHLERLMLGVIPETGQAVWIHGTPDFVCQRDGIPEAFDWKTSKQGWSEAKFVTKVQWPIYTWLLEPLNPNLDLNWTVLVWSAKGNDWERYELPFENKYGDVIAMNPRYVEATLKNFWQMARCMAFDCYPAIPMSTHGPWGQVRPWYNTAAYNGAWNEDPFRILLDGKNDEEAPFGWD